MKSSVCTLHSPASSPPAPPPPFIDTRQLNMDKDPVNARCFIVHLPTPQPTRHTRSTCQLLAVCNTWLATSHCSTLQYTATHYNALRAATHCNTLQHTTTQRTATHGSLQHTITHCNAWRVATHCNKTHCNTLQHAAAHCNILQQQFPAQKC